LGLTHVLQIPWYIDGTRAVALGASFGGYLINWITGHPEMSQRFRALVSHDGLFDMREMAYATEELWFTPYDMPEAFEKFNPVNHVANWSQPMLIIQGGRDYRVPDTQSIGAFTALQRRGIPSRLLYFLIESVIKID
jgi:dipeptidyl aminopeptidase/acylaminoacyl peptidase